MTHPSVEGQGAVIQSAYQSAGLSPSQTSYVECHGTGTPVGDPIEVEAIHKAMGAPRAVSDPVLIGSVGCTIQPLAHYCTDCRTGQAQYRT